MSQDKLKHRRTVLREGDVFEFDVPDGHLGYGVVVVGGGVPYVIILRSLHRSRPTMADLKADDIALVGWTMDALIHKGRWRIAFSGYPRRSDIPYPNHIVALAGGLMVTDFRGTVLGPAREGEIGLLEHQGSRAPIGYEKAFLALHGFVPWTSDCDRLTADYVRRRATRLSAA